MEWIQTVNVIFVFVAVSGTRCAGDLCRSSCGTVPINYPFSIDDGCGAPEFRQMFNCSPPDLFFQTPSGSYKVRRIDYANKNLVVYDPSMSTCSMMQPQHSLLLSDVQSTIIRPSSDTIFALLNCSIDSPILNHYRNLCFSFSGHSCDELYTCNAFRIFRMFTNSSPPCCLTGYDTVHFMSMNILDCSHYTTVIDTVNSRGLAPMDWEYGIKLSYSIPETGCLRCSKTGGSCGFDTESQAFQCLCSPTTNATRECGFGTVTSSSPEMSSRRCLQGPFLTVLLLVFASCSRNF